LANYRNLAGVGVFVACASLCASFEGLDTRAYHDTLAHGIPTVCYGETEGVKMGDHYTPIECKQMLAHKLPRYWREISRCIHVRISENETIAYTDFAYNVGSRAFCHSNVARHLNSGDHLGACNGLLIWDVAGGKHVWGLKRRRIAERELCLRPSAFDKSLDAFVNDAPKPLMRDETDFCSGSGQGADCHRKHPTYAESVELSRDLPPQRPPVCRRWWFFWKVCN
jgi:lysozyme